MPFEWMQSKIGVRPSHREEAYRQELMERAALLYRLHYSAVQAKARLAANVKWDYEVGHAKSPVPMSDVAGIVDGVYARHGVGAGSLTV